MAVQNWEEPWEKTQGEHPQSSDIQVWPEGQSHPELEENP